MNWNNGNSKKIRSFVFGRSHFSSYCVIMSCKSCLSATGVVIINVFNAILLVVLIPVEFPLLGWFDHGRSNWLLLEYCRIDVG